MLMFLSPQSHSNCIALTTNGWDFPSQSKSLHRCNFESPKTNIFKFRGVWALRGHVSIFFIFQLFFIYSILFSWKQQSHVTYVSLVVLNFRLSGNKPCDLDLSSNMRYQNILATSVVWKLCHYIKTLLL